MTLVSTNPLYERKLCLMTPVVQSLTKKTYSISDKTELGG